ncbi:class I SAM-dependent methyltransferase [Dactylosporangium salmoneum]|uniref:Class I SAM-dependent methyltransferase n=1 Tax=Dactylosporangium salmoneum TaxID=53361 RepID=A0ABP5SA15_9ACTN
MTDWLTDTRASYDTVAAAYADAVRGSLTGDPYVRAALSLFATLAGGDGPVADAGCGPGHVTAHLRGLGVDAFGLDLSPAMIDVARRDHPGVRFEVGSMTRLPLEDASLSGLLAWWSLVHTPDEALPQILSGFHRVLRPGAPLAVGFHAGEGARLKTEGYGGHPMHVYVYRRTPAAMTARLQEAGFTVEAELCLDPSTPSPSAVLFARS